MWEGGSADCDHVETSGTLHSSTLGQPSGTFHGSSKSHQGLDADGAHKKTYRDECGKCGARRVDQQLGLESTPEAYVARMVEVFREVRRVLRADGTLWLNIGDSYNGSSGTGGATAKQVTNAGSFHDGGTRLAPGLKPKDLCGVPWRLAFALQADGWYLRSAITWCKPNAMPESVTDRPSKATEMVFLLTRSPRYYYDAESIRTEHQRDGRAITEVMGRDGSIQHRDGERWPGSGANAKDWWLIATEPFTARALPGGAPRKVSWEREVEREVHVQGRGRDHIAGGDDTIGKGWEGTPRATLSVETTGWRPGCEHGSEGEGGGEALWQIQPCVVLDPFLGSGTSAYVARRLGRRSIGIELSTDYCQLAARRMQQQSLFALEAS